MYSYNLWGFSSRELPEEVTLKKAPSMKYVKLKKTSMEGGEGVLYVLEGSNRLIAKIFKKKESAEKKAPKIEAFVELFKKLIEEDYWKRIFENNITMPRARLYTDDDILAGFLMNYIELKKAISLKNFIEEKYKDYKRWNDWFVKLYVAKKFIDIIKELHRIGIIVGDLNPKNIFIKSNGEVVILDCDSMQLTYKGRVYPLDAILRDIAPPEVIKYGAKGVSIKSDVFSAAIHVYRILMKGFSPFQFRSSIPEDRNTIIMTGKNIFNNPYPPAGLPPLEALGPYLLDVLPRCLEVDPNKRPFLDELSTALYFTILDLRVCSNGHITVPYLKKCYICGDTNLKDFDKSQYNL
ncbi:MAG TPA: hypothetical protein EYP32_05755 [Aquificaceae bacterium]|nr:hypothetical protein [Aquificaceae bacterium]